MENKQKAKKLVIVLIAILAVGFYVWQKVNSQTISGEYPIAKVKYYKHWVRITPEEGVAVDSLLDKSLFHDFPAEEDIDYVIENFGNPDNIREEDHNTYYEYSFDETRIEIAREEYSTGSDIGISWATYSFPYDKLYTDVLSNDVSKYVDPTNNKTSVVINDQYGDIVYLVMLSGNRVTEMIRYK